MLAPTQLETALGTQNLTTLVRNFMDATVGSRTLTGFFRRGRPIQVLPGNNAVWDVLTGRRHLAPLSGPSSPHVQVAQAGQGQKTTACAWIKLYKDIPGHRLFDERAPGQLLPGADLVIGYELMDLANMLGDTVERMCGLALSTGKVTGSAANFPGTQTPFDVDFGASQNLAFTRSAAWATDTTKILATDLPTNLRKAYRDGSGTEPGFVIGNSTIEASLMNNTEVKAFLTYVAGPQMVKTAGALEGLMPSQFGLGGLQWPLSVGAFKPEGGSVTPYFPDNYIAVLPIENELPNTLGMAVGRGIVPTGPVFLPEAERAASGLTVVGTPGPYSYAEIKGEVPAVRIYAGWTGLPVILDPIKLMRGNA